MTVHEWDYRFSNDCEHLRACRRMAKIYRDAGAKFVARGCNDDCSAYEQRKQEIDIGATAQRIVDAIEYGESPNDVVAEAASGFYSVYDCLEAE